MTGLMWALPVCLVVFVLGIVFFAILLGVIVNLRRRKDPFAVQRWAHCAYSLWTGGEDCGLWPMDRAQTSLKSWYGATDRSSLLEVIADLEKAEQTGNRAWDEVRALDLLRIGFAAGYLSDDDCWDHVRAIAEDLRKHYKGWEDLAKGFEAGMLAWHDRRGVTDAGERGRVQRNLPVLREHVWPRTAWNARL